MSTFIIIDSNAIMHRAYHALPPFKTKKGELVNAVYGFFSILLKIIKDLKPDYLAAAFDLAGPTFRDKMYKDYKAKRVKPAQEFYNQIPKIKEIIRALDIPIYAKSGFEADDIIGAVVKTNEKNNQEIKNIIITGDLDTLQLVSEKTEVDFQKGIKQTNVCDLDYVKKRYGLLPKELVDFKGLRGDASDNIKGVPGIGEKTAKELIKKFGSIEKLYQGLERSDVNQKLKARLLEYKEQALLSRDLSKIKTDIAIDFDLSSCLWPGNLDKNKAIKLLEELEFKSLIKRFSEIMV